MLKIKVVKYRIDGLFKRDFSIQMETDRRVVWADYYGNTKFPYAVIYGEKYEGSFTEKTLAELLMSKYVKNRKSA